MLKKTLSLILVLAMVFVFAACSSTPASQAPAEEPQAPAEESPETVEEEPPAEEEPATEEPTAGDVYTIKYVMLSNSTTDQEPVVEAAINEYIEPLINAHVDFSMVSGGPVWQQQVLTPLQAGECFDIIFTSDAMWHMDNVSKGLLLPLNDPNGPYGDLVNTYAPDTVENLGAFIPANIINGFLYSIPTKKELCVPGGLIWNQDYVDKYNIDITTVETAQDLKPYLEQFVADPDNAGVYPLLVGVGGISYDTPFMQGFVGNVETVTMRMGNPGEEQEPESYWEAPETRKYCETMEEYYEAGYLDPDSYLTSFGAMDFLNLGKFMVTPCELKGGQVKANELKSSSGNDALRLVEYQTTKQNSSGNTSVVVTAHAGGSMLGIPVTSGNPVAAMQYINLMHMDPTLLNMMVWGIEGVHYNLNENGMVVPVENNGWSNAHMGPWTMGDQFKQLIAATEDPAKYDQMLALTAEAWNHCSLGFRFDPTPVQNEITALNNVGETYSKPMKTGVNVTENYDTMIEELKTAGLQTVLDEVTKQYDAWKAENPTDPGAAFDVAKTE